MDPQDYQCDDYDYDDQNYNQYNDYQVQSSQAKYRVLPQSQLFDQVLKVAQQCIVITALPLGWSILLLRQFKWQIDNIPEYFQDVKKFRKKIKYSEHFKSPTDSSLMSFSMGECPVCCGTGRLITNVCGDSFCEGCWFEQIVIQFDSMNPFVCCMNCSTPVVHEIIIKLLQFHPMGLKYTTKYEKLICEQFTTVNRSYQCCPGIDCTYCIKCQDYDTSTVKCNCGKLFCFKCKHDDHSPCTCEEKLKWEQIVMKQEADAKWMAINTKLCPWCNKAVERSAGCNYMACLCGKSFCYMCSKPWQPDHKDHFKCHIYKKKDNLDVDKEKAILQKMNFYADKYLNTNAVVNHLKKVDTFSKRRLLFEALNIDLTQTDFIEQAYRFAIQCCDGLKWIYVYRYFVKFENEQKKQIFEFTQGEYEKYKQQLLKKLSFDLKKFLGDLEQQYILMGKINKKNDHIEKFGVLKKNIINYFTCTKQFKEKFMEEIDKVDLGIVKRYSEDKQQAPDLKCKKSSGSKKPSVISRLIGRK